MVTENGMVMMSYAEYKGMKAAEDKLAELLISNEMLRKAMLQLTNKGNKTDIRVSRSDFVKMYDMTTSEIFKTNIEKNDINGYEVTVHWHGMYCSCSDKDIPSNYIISAILDCDEVLDGEER